MWIAERRIGEEGVIREALKERDEIVGFARRNRKAPDTVALLRTRVAAARIVLNDILQRADASVVHVRRGHGNIAKSGRSKLGRLWPLRRCREKTLPDRKASRRQKSWAPTG